MRKHITATVFMAILAGTLNIGCNEDNDDTSTTVRTAKFAGVQGDCTNGGVKIEVLVNGAVDASQTQYLCDGAQGQSGTNTAVRTSSFSGVQGDCTNGGVKIEVLLDGVVQNDLTQYVCNGINGEDGQSGPSGKICDSNGCVCDAANHFVSTDAGDCICDAAHHWVLNSAGNCVCDAYLYQGECIAKGETITFGKYPQATATLDPIEWILLDVVPKSGGTNGRFLLLSKYIIDTKAFDKSHQNAHDAYYCDYPTWEDSDIRKWLNDSSSSGFLSSEYFTPQELANIVEVTNSTSDSKEFNGSLDGGPDTNDRVFLLDRADVENPSYFPDASSLHAMATSYAIEQGAYVLSSSLCGNVECVSRWWLRSSGDDVYSANYIRVDEIRDDHVDWGQGIRPALWVKY